MISKVKVGVDKTKGIHLSKTFSTSYQRCSILGQISAKPPLSGRIIIRCATEVGVDGTIETKVVFTADRTSGRVEGATTVTADVKKVSIQNLPELCCGATSSHMSTNVHVIHKTALAVTKIRHYVKLAERTPDVISVINSIHEVEAASCSPVCRAAAEAIHSTQGLAVDVPVWCILVDGCVLFKRFASKMGKIL